MKIGKEKRYRKEYVRNPLDRIVEQMVRSVREEKKEAGKIEKVRGKMNSYRNICQDTGRARGVIREYSISRHRYRELADKGSLEGVKRAS